jgi:hypothetical protein
VGVSKRREASTPGERLVEDGLRGNTGGDDLASCMVALKGISAGRAKAIIAISTWLVLCWLVALMLDLI